VRRIVAFVVPLLIAPCLALPAHARTLLVTRPGAGDDQRRVRQALRGAPGEVQTIGDDELDRALLTARRGLRLKEARRLAREGWLLLGHLKLARAARLLHESLERYAAVPEEPRSCAEAVQVLRDLAYARWLQKDRARAAVLLAGVAALPPRQVDATRHPPDFVAFMKAPAPRQAPPVSTPVVSDVDGAEVWLNCVRRGPAPRELPIAGSGLVAVTAPGQSWSRLVVTREGAVLHAAPRPPDARQQRAALGAVLRARGANELVRWRRQGALLQTRSFRPEEGWGAWRPLALGQARPGPERRRRGWRAGQWALLGSSAAALVAGTVCGALAGSAANELEQAAEQSRNFDSGLAGTEDRRDRLAVAAYCGWGAGAALGAALVTWLLLDRD
jgi:hypothetical protein